MPTPLDSNLSRQVGKYVETLTHTGQKVLDKDVLKKLKNICKISDGYVEHAYHLLIYQLEKAHAEIRFSAFQICNELFRRSHFFRELLVSNMQHVMELTCETSSDRLLPPPRSVALSLKRMALQCIQEWNKEYGDGYKKLQLGYNFLKHCKKVDFNALQIENSAEQVRQQEQERRQNLINQEKLKKIMIEINEMQPEITNTLTALENCICLLFPTPEDFFIQDGNETETKSKISDEKPSPSNCSGTKQTEDQNKNEEQDLDQKDRLSELIESARKVEEKKNIVKNDSDVPSISRSKDDDDMEEDNSEFGSETSDSEEDIDFREYGILNSKYSIEVNVNTGIC
ncbi:hypothetical protein B7P43_G13514 [Cryptotermes secundus]|uniref:UV-stimulated scaffold protein A n=1 Tax=Cryptotermes secundus TaxID=105785 RepID=A0A2J7PYU7_9NEOP|nr:hypothetical protein B7P43_G13514 [Cryptotermes secundus]